MGSRGSPAALGLDGPRALLTPRTCARRSAVVLCACLAACGGAPQAPPSVRTVVLVSVDTLRADHLGCYGGTAAKTPNLDAFASDAVRFASAVAPATTTLHSHTSLMTGTYGRTHGVPRNGFVVAEENAMLAEVMGAAGYETAGFIGGYPLHSRFGFAQGFEHYDEPEVERSGEAVNASALRWLDERLEGPLFLFVHYWDAHYPYTPPPPFDRVDRPDGLDAGGSMQEILAVRRDLLAGIPAEERSRVLRALYAGEVAHVDHLVGAFLDGLHARGRYEDALIVLTSDHGEALGEHGENFDHGAHAYETTAHVPLIVRLPGGERGGTVEARPVSLIDVAPTLLDLVGVPVPPRATGVGFAAGLRGQPLGPRGAVFTEATKPHAAEVEGARWLNERKCRAVRDGRWKLLQRPLDGVLELYDLDADPGEERNLLPALEAEASDSAARLADLLDRFGAGARWARSAREAAPAAWERLGHLGYQDGD